MTLRDVIQRDMEIISKTTTDNIELLQVVNTKLLTGELTPELTMLKKHLDDSTLGASRKTLNNAIHYITDIEKKDVKPVIAPPWTDTELEQEQNLLTDADVENALIEIEGKLEVVNE